MSEWITPPGHVQFLAKKLFEEEGQQLVDGSVACLRQGGGGPLPNHTHEHNHLFIVVKGKARLELGGESVLVGENESCLVRGTVPHSVWNALDSETLMIGLTTRDSDR
jgi:mannose-6-phosphate isomerase-like protein (cupin superfamily)